MDAVLLNYIKASDERWFANVICGSSIVVCICSQLKNYSFLIFIYDMRKPK